MKVTLDCRALVRLLSHSQDGTLPLTSRARMRLHLLTCESCRKFDEQMRFVRTAMQELRVNQQGKVPVAEPLQLQSARSALSP
jgi:predicted anti-sigma-YlaC factor YlaD